MAEAPICASELTVMTTQGPIIHMICFSDEVGFQKVEYTAWTGIDPPQQKKMLTLTSRISPTTTPLHTFNGTLEPRCSRTQQL